jgi:hypothetical protein
VKLTRVSCDRFRSNQMRVTQSVIAINVGERSAPAVRALTGWCEPL